MLIRIQSLSFHDTRTNVHASLRIPAGLCFGHHCRLDTQFRSVCNEFVAKVFFGRCAGQCPLISPEHKRDFCLSPGRGSLVTAVCWKEQIRFPCDLRHSAGAECRSTETGVLNLIFPAVGQQILRDLCSRWIEGSFDLFWVRHAEQDASFRRPCWGVSWQRTSEPEW